MSHPNASDEEKMRDADLYAVLEHPGGRRFLFDLMYRRLRWAYASEHGPQGIRDEGKRDAALALNKEIRTKFTSLWMHMHSEGNAALAEKELKREAPRTKEIA